MGDNPKIAAERLLRSVLPEDLCVSLSAINECEVQGKKHRYKIFKGQKTHCFQGDKTFSCCIQLSDPAAPDTDRIIAEFLLIKNNEEEYLKTANLTQIGGPQERPQVRHIRRIATCRPVRWTNTRGLIFHWWCISTSVSIGSLT